MVINSVTYRWIYFFIYLSVAEVKFNPQTPSPLTPHPLMPKSGLVSDICGIKIQQELFYRLHPIFHLTLASFSFFFYALHCLIEQEHVAPCRTKKKEGRTPRLIPSIQQWQAVKRAGIISSAARLTKINVLTESCQACFHPLGVDFEISSQGFF